MGLNFTGAFKVIARLPEGPMNLHPYLHFNMGDTTITQVSEEGRYKLSLNPTFMNRCLEFTLGEEFEQTIPELGTFKTTFILNGENELVQTAISSQSNEILVIRRIYNGKPISFYAHKEQVEIRMSIDGNAVPWFYVMVTR